MMPFLYMNICVLTPVILFGLLGNVLSMLTWSRGRHRNTSTAALLTALAVMDTLVLAMPALEYWVLHVLNIWIRRSNIYACKVFGFASYFCPTSSSWIIVLVTAERLVSIWFPIRVRRVCTRTKMCLCMLLVWLVVAAVYSPFIVEAELFVESDLNVTTCDLDKNGTFFIHFYAPLMWVDLCLLFMIPFILIVIANALILYKILKSRRVFVRQCEYKSYRTRVANAFTIRAIVLSIFFLICLLPVSTYEVYYAYTVDNDALTRNICQILLYANSALNFILYCVVGSGFRKDMKTVLLNLCTKKEVVCLDDHDGRSTSCVQQSLMNRNNKLPNSNC